MKGAVPGDGTAEATGSTGGRSGPPAHRRRSARARSTACRPTTAGCRSRRHTSRQESSSDGSARPTAQGTKHAVMASVSPQYLGETVRGVDIRQRAVALRDRAQRRVVELGLDEKVREARDLRLGVALRALGGEGSRSVRPPPRPRWDACRRRRRPSRRSRPLGGFDRRRGAGQVVHLFTRVLGDSEEETKNITALMMPPTTERSGGDPRPLLPLQEERDEETMKPRRGG